MAKKPPIFEANQVPEHLRANRSAFTRWFGKTFLRVFGWHVEGSIANAERVLITAAPHTSNWDAVFGIAAVLGLNVRLHFQVNTPSLYRALNGLCVGQGVFPLIARTQRV